MLPVDLRRHRWWLLLAAVVAGLVLFGPRLSGFGGGVATAWAHGAFGSASSVALTLESAGVLTLVGLAFLLPFQGGLFNIGAEGQLYAGGLAAVLVGVYASLPAGLHFGAALCAAALAGAGWAALAGALKCWRGAHEVVTTIMLNYIAVGMSRYLVDGPLNAGTYAAQTQPVAVTAQLPVLWSAPPMAVDVGVVLAGVLAVLVALGLRRTVWGYELRVVGGNPRAATEAGISQGRAWFVSLLLGGAMAGLAGAELVLGMERVFTATLSPGFGYDGIAVALLAGGEAWAVPLSALLFASLRSADKALQLEAGLSPRVIYVVQAVLILAVAARAAWRPHWRRSRPMVRAEVPWGS